MKTTSPSILAMLAVALLPMLVPAQDTAPAGRLRLHAIFDSDMVLQRDKPINIWGWAAPGYAVQVQLGADKAEASADAGKGRWEVTFPARPASAEPQTLTVTAGGEKVEMGNIVVGDVWVMYGQSNMAFPLGKVANRDTESECGSSSIAQFVEREGRFCRPSRRLYAWAAGFRFSCWQCWASGRPVPSPGFSLRIMTAPVGSNRVTSDTRTIEESRRLRNIPARRIRSEYPICSTAFP